MVAISFNVQNSLCCFEISSLFNLPRFQTCAIKCIERWFCYLLANKNHSDLSFDSFRKLLSSSELEITSEMELVVAVDSWI